MKKITFLALLFLSVTMMASAQKSTRTTAYNYLRKGKLDLAKENIDKAVGHEKTMNDPKTWFYYGNTYIQLATTPLDVFKELDPDALQKAYDGYMKCMELDTKGTYTDQVEADLKIIANNYYARGLAHYNANEYPAAYKEFEEAIAVNKSINSVDTLAVYASSMSAFSGEMYPEAITGYESLITMEYDNSGIYGDLANIYKSTENLERAKEVLEMGIQKYPNDANIVFAKINILLTEEKYEEVVAYLESAIQLAPENYTLYFVQGQSYEQMGDLENARLGYEKALEVNPEYSDALYNMGALYYNKGVELSVKANDLPYDAEEEFKALKEEASKEFLIAQPYFEKALEIMPGDEGLVKSLMQIYNSTDQSDKAAELKNK